MAAVKAIRLASLGSFEKQHGKSVASLHLLDPSFFLRKKLNPTSKKNSTVYIHVRITINHSTVLTHCSRISTRRCSRRGSVLQSVSAWNSFAVTVVGRGVFGLLLLFCSSVLLTFQETSLITRSSLEVAGKAVVAIVVVFVLWVLTIGLCAFVLCCDGEAY